MMNQISIITTTYNAAASLRHCFASLAEQTVPFEHVVVDGGSQDGTLEIIAAHKSLVSQFVSEPDRGLYDALNKGIGMATGEIVGILHADDFFASPHVLERVTKLFEDSAVDACYGDLLYVAEERDTQGAGQGNLNKSLITKYKSQITNHGSRFSIKRYWKSGEYDPRKFYWGWMPPHPTFFVRRSVYEKCGLFNLELGTAADYELMLRFLLKHRINCQYIPEVMTCMRVGGMSNATFGNRLRANRMDRKAWEVNGLKPHPWTIPLKPIRKISQYFMKPWDCRVGPVQLIEIVQ